MQPDQPSRLSEFGAVLDRVLFLHPREVVIDLSGCRHIDAAAIGLLLDVHRRLARRRAVLTVRNPHARIRRILDTARVGEVLRIVDTPGRSTSLPPDGRLPRDRPFHRPAVHGRAKVATRPLR